MWVCVSLYVCERVCARVRVLMCSRYVRACARACVRKRVFVHLALYLCVFDYE